MNKVFNKIKLIFQFFLLLITAPYVYASNIIDILVVYTPGVYELYGEDTETRINHLFQLTNQIYSDSRLDLEIRLAGMMMVNYTDENDGAQALKDITFAQEEAFKDVKAKRDLLQADMVIFYRPFKNSHNTCGQAWVGGTGTQGDFSAEKDYMYSHIPINSCGDFSTAHELGHNMGLRHSRTQHEDGGTFDFATGYGELNKFATIMAHQSEYNVDYWEGKAYKFSSPNLLCKGLPCGMSREDKINGADARYALTITTPQIASFYATASESQSSRSSSSTSSAASSMSSSSSSEKNRSENHQENISQENKGGGGFLSIYWIIFMSLFATIYNSNRKNNSK